MEKLSRISKVVDKVLMVAYRILLIVSVVCTVLLGVVYFVDGAKDTMVEGTWSLGLGDIDLTLAENAVSNEMMQSQIVFLVSVMVTGVIFFGYAIKVLRSILAPMIEGKPFVGTVSGDLKKLGWTVIIGSVVLGTVQAIVKTMLYTTFDVQNLLLSDKIVGVECTITVFDVKTILLGVLLFLLSHVFCYGEKLQQQDDETL